MTRDTFVAKPFSLHGRRRYCIENNSIPKRHRKSRLTGGQLGIWVLKGSTTPRLHRGERVVPLIRIPSNDGRKVPSRHSRKMLPQCTVLYCVHIVLFSPPRGPCFFQCGHEGLRCKRTTDDLCSVMTCSVSRYRHVLTPNHLWGEFK